MIRSSLALLGAACVLALSACATNPESATVQTKAGSDPLLAGFVDPPRSARPRTWWHWMNGNITQEGISRDLAWMDRIGLGGFQAFDAALQTPQVVEERLVYMTPEWCEAFRFAAGEAARHELEMAIAASPGWSETGGPWVPPEDGMKKLVWGETRLEGGKAFSGTFTRAPDVTGPFQAMHFEDELAAVSGTEAPEPPRAAGRIAVLAVPLEEPALPRPRFTLADGSELPADPLLDADYESGVALPLAEDRSGLIVATFPEDVTARTLHLAMPGLVRPFRGSPLKLTLEAENEGEWQEVAELPLTNVPTTHAFEPVTARAFRLRVADNAQPGAPAELEGAEGAIVVDVFALGDLSSAPLNDFRLSGAQRLGRAEEKAGFSTVLDYYAITSQDDSPVALALNDVIDLTGQVSEEGRLTWTPPAGSDWLVLDFGWSLTGKTNHPAPPEATGLEVDKFDAAAVRRYLETYLGMYREIVGDELMGERGVAALLTDSIEVGLANWTPLMEREFETRRGYALRPWLPALTGVVIGSEAATEAFLYDYRRTLAELLTEHHYATVAEVAHENGLVVYGEALEDRRPLLGDDLAMRRHADIPMAALWAFPRGGQVRTTLLGDMLGAASTAHVYGKPFVAAESMTAVSSPWAFAPRDLKRFVDLEFAHGINRPVIHTSVHVPVEDRKPGLSLAIFGQYFNRNETWAEMARPWIDYIARSSYLLQQGHYTADIALFMGEEAPLTAQYANGVPKGLPRRYAFDFVNAAMLEDALRVEDGLLVSAGGTRYRVLHLGGTSRMMTLPTLRRIAELASQGASVVGPRPEATPSLADDPAEFARLVEEVWALPNVADTADVETALAQMGVAPDFTFTGGAADTEILLLHRKSEDADIYFVNNRRNRPERVEARFRVAGKSPELWNAITGAASPLSYRREGEITVVPLDLGPEDAKFVVFREPSEAALREVPAPAEQEVGRIAGPWTVTFQEGRGAPPSIELDVLQPLNEHALDPVKYFSGIATYETSFDLPAGVPPGEPLWLDLGAVGEVAEVFVNGERVGITWFAPDRIDIGSHVRSGDNQLEVRVANLWVNRLIGDKQEGVDPITFTAAPTYRSDATLRPSGLIGPVGLLVSN